MYTVSKLNLSTGLWEFLYIEDNPNRLARKMRSMMPGDRNLYRIGDPHSSMDGDRWLDRYEMTKFIQGGTTWQPKKTSMI